jgi:hypothetical protein
MSNLSVIHSRTQYILSTFADEAKLVKSLVDLGRALSLPYPKQIHHIAFKACYPPDPRVLVSISPGIRTLSAFSLLPLSILRAGRARGQIIIMAGKAHRVVTGRGNRDGGEVLLRGGGGAERMRVMISLNRMSIAYCDVAAYFDSSTGGYVGKSVSEEDDVVGGGGSSLLSSII